MSENNLLEKKQNDEKDNISNSKNENLIMNTDLENTNKTINNTSTTFKVSKKQFDSNMVIKKNSKIGTFISIFICLLILLIISFFTYNLLNTNIAHNVYILDIDVSNTSPSDAKYTLDKHIESLIPNEIFLQYGTSKASISTEQLDASFDTKSAVDEAYSIGRNDNLLQNNFNSLISFFYTTNITPNLTLDEEQLINYLDDLSATLPDTVIESSYYIEGNNLIITSGSSGNVIDKEKTIESIKNSIINLDFKNPITITTKVAEPTDINIDHIYSEIYKEPVDAYYTTDPFAVYPSENGLDFNISIDEAKSIVSSEEKEEYIIPLKTISANVTTNMIGSEAFPDLLGTQSSRYNIYDNDRTTNVILSSNKINGVVLMPGEVFSYNKVVGERTIEAGYKEASIYVDGKVVDGLGGGICQTTTNLYNAVLYANLEIVERTNHQFIPPYSSASRDATVVYGLSDFQFKNTRDYPIKISSTVSNGTATVQIHGLKQETEYDVEIRSYQTGSTATAIYSEAYRILSLNGTVVSQELLSKDTYKK